MNGFANEEDYFGEKIGSVTLNQLPYSEFQQECLHSKSSVHDNTGLRLYSAAHIGVRLLAHLSHLIENKSVVELGCGVGAMSLIGTRQAHPSKVLLTDGELKTLEITKRNFLLIYGDSDEGSVESKILFEQLKWGDDAAVIDLLKRSNDGQPFDVVVGSELTYYSTVMSALVQTVLCVTAGCGLFIHAHMFRKDGQEVELIDLFHTAGWVTYELPLRSFISAQELQHHPEWFKMRALLSGPSEVVRRLVVERTDLSSCVLFAEEPVDDSDDDEEEQQEGLAGMFS